MKVVPNKLNLERRTLFFEDAVLLVSYHTFVSANDYPKSRKIAEKINHFNTLVILKDVYKKLHLINYNVSVMLGKNMQ